VLPQAHTGARRTHLKFKTPSSPFSARATSTQACRSARTLCRNASSGAHSTRATESMPPTFNRNVLLTVQLALMFALVPEGRAGGPAHPPHAGNAAGVVAGPAHPRAAGAPGRHAPPPHAIRLFILKTLQPCKHTVAPRRMYVSTTKNGPEHTTRMRNKPNPQTHQLCQ
jgi:hypothetical protein